MPKRVLDVGQCQPDHAAISDFLVQHFRCEVTRAHGPEDALRELKKTPFNLVLVNRKLDRDYTDGIEVIRRMKADSDTAAVPVMLVTNYAEHQEAAIQAGALRGFGKLEYDKPETLEAIRAVLSD